MMMVPTVLDLYKSWSFARSGYSDVRGDFVTAFVVALIAIKTFLQPD